jgi:hypothetical protein
MVIHKSHRCCAAEIIDEETASICGRPVDLEADGGGDLVHLPDVPFAIFTPLCNEHSAVMQGVAIITHRTEQDTPYNATDSHL